jgi:ubiquinone/menaquinone biosynthesis C-methylase UbiE
MEDKFKDRAKDWDAPEKIKMTEIFVAELRRHIELQSHWRALEIGAGTGLVGLQILPEIDSVVFEDTSDAMLQVLKQKLKPDSRVNIVHGEVFEYLTVDIDIVVACMSFHHIEDISKTIQHLANITTPNAIVAIGDIMQEDGSFHRFEPIPHKGFDNQWLASQFQLSGFDVLCNKEYNTLVRERIPGVLSEYKQFLLIVRKS